MLRVLCRYKWLLESLLPLGLYNDCVECSDLLHLACVVTCHITPLVRQWMFSERYAVRCVLVYCLGVAAFKRPPPCPLCRGYQCSRPAAHLCSSALSVAGGIDGRVADGLPCSGVGGPVPAVTGQPMSITAQLHAVCDPDRWQLIAHSPPADPAATLPTRRVPRRQYPVIPPETRS